MTLEAPARIAPPPWRASERSKTGSCTKIHSADGTTYFEYTPANMVSRVAKLGGSEWQFGYDGNDERYAIVKDGTATYYLWEGMRLLETRGADYSLEARYTHASPPASGGIEGIGTCVEVYRASDGKKFYPVYDHRGSMWALLDSSKAVVASRVYNAYGEVISESGSWPDVVPFGYQSNWLAPPGMTAPDGTQLYLPKRRIYVPKPGRFLQRDPLQTPGENLYVYARANPVNLVDPEGLLSCADYEQMTTDELMEASKKLRDRINKNPGSNAARAAKKELAKINDVAWKRHEKVADAWEKGGDPGRTDANLQEARDLWEMVNDNADAMGKVPVEAAKPVPPRRPPKTPIGRERGGFAPPWEEEEDEGGFLSDLLLNMLFRQERMNAATLAAAVAGTVSKHYLETSESQATRIVGILGSGALQRVAERLSLVTDPLTPGAIIRDVMEARQGGGLARFLGSSDLGSPELSDLVVTPGRLPSQFRPPDRLVRAYQTYQWLTELPDIYENRPEELAEAAAPVLGDVLLAGTVLAASKIAAARAGGTGWRFQTYPRSKAYPRTGVGLNKVDLATGKRVPEGVVTGVDFQWKMARRPWYQKLHLHAAKPGVRFGTRPGYEGRFLKHAHLPWEGLGAWYRAFPVKAPAVTAGAAGAVAGAGYGAYRLIRAMRKEKEK